MIARLIAWSAKNLMLVFVATAFAVVAGVWAVRTLPLDAIPDLSDTQVIVYTEFPGQAPQVVEDQVTYPLTTSMLTVPRSKVVRGFSILWRVVRLRHLRGRHRHLLGALARPRIPECSGQKIAGRRNPNPRPRCQRRGLGLSVRCAGQEQVAGGFALVAGLGDPLWSLQSGRRR